MSGRLLVAVALGVGLVAGYVAGTRRGAPAVAPQAGAPRQLWTCGMHPQVLQDKPGPCPICGMALTPVQTTADAAADTSVRIDPVVVQNMGIRVAPATEGPLRVRLRAAGSLVEAEPRRHDVNLRVSGWIERLYADTEGAHVAAGDPLFDLYSPELQVAVQELIAAGRAGGDGGTLASATARKLRLWGLSEAQVERLGKLERAPATISFVSPVHGHVVEKNVVAGAAVQAGTRVLRIVDHSLLWLDAQVFEQDLPLVRVGQEASASFPGRPGERFSGTIVFVHPHVEEMTRAAAVRIEVANPTLALRPGMYGTVEILIERTAAAVQVPREAVIDTGVRQVVFVAAGEGRFEPRPVGVGAPGEDGVVEIVAGLRAGETVVTSGQFLLDAESRFKEAIAKHLATGLLAPPPGHVH
jgi:multidrug efflux pump subunit AcrA (membrane-fusion protein)